MEVILFDDESWQQLLPLSFTRPVAEMRVGILTIKEKWEKHIGATASYLTQPHLAKKYPIHATKENILINSSVLPNEALAKKIKSLELGDALVKGGITIAAKCTKAQICDISAKRLSDFSITEFDGGISKITYPWDIFSANKDEIELDFEMLTRGRTSEPAPDNSTRTIGNRVFIEPGAKICCAVLNSTNGPIYIGKDAEIMEGSLVRGPFALCEGSILKMGAKIYGPTTIGPHSKVGGEVSSSIILGYSNKAHDGYLGNSVIGEWCNLGANTNVSNLKNNFALVKVWNYPQRRFVQTGLQFCGIIMGDYSKTGINTMLSTGTSVGVCTNLFGTGFPRNFIPSFAWGGTQGYITYKSINYIPTITATLARRGKSLTDVDKEILSAIFDMTEKDRSF